MKHTLKRLLITSLSTVCLLANNPINAMEEEKDSLQDSSFNFSSSQNLSGSVVISMEDLSKMLTQDQMMTLLSKSQMSNTQIQNSQLFQSNLEDELSLLSSLEGADLLPHDDEFGVSEINNAVKFMAKKLSSENFSESSLGFGNQNPDRGIFSEFSKANKKSIAAANLNSDRSLILVLKMITQKFNLCSYLPDLTPWRYQNIPSHLANNQGEGSLLIMQCAGAKHGQLSFVKLDRFWQEIKQVVNTLYGPGAYMLAQAYNNHPYGYNQPHMGQQQQPQITPEAVLKTIREELNKLLSFPGYDFDIERKAKEVSGIAENWFKVTPKAAKVLLKHWEHKGPLLENLQRDYNYVDMQLKQAEQGSAFFLTVDGKPYSIALGQVRDKTDNFEFLKDTVTKHKEAHKQELMEYQNNKNVLPIVQKLVDWTKEVVEDISKKGRIS